jgi:hypothetical protein
LPLKVTPGFAGGGGGGVVVVFEPQPVKIKERRPEITGTRETETLRGRVLTGVSIPKQNSS